MFQFMFGVVVGFLGVWLYGGTATEDEIRLRGKELGRAAQRASQQLAAEAKGSAESIRHRPMS